MLAAKARTVDVSYAGPTAIGRNGLPKISRSKSTGKRVAREELVGVSFRVLDDELASPAGVGQLWEEEEEVIPGRAVVPGSVHGLEFCERSGEILTSRETIGVSLGQFEVGSLLIAARPSEVAKSLQERNGEEASGANAEPPRLLACVCRPQRIWSSHVSHSASVIGSPTSRQPGFRLNGAKSVNDNGRRSRSVASSCFALLVTSSLPSRLSRASSCPTPRPLPGL